MIISTLNVYMYNNDRNPLTLTIILYIQVNVNTSCTSVREALTTHVFHNLTVNECVLLVYFQNKSILISNWGMLFEPGNWSSYLVNEHCSTILVVWVNTCDYPYGSDHPHSVSVFHFFFTIHLLFFAYLAFESCLEQFSPFIWISLSLSLQWAECHRSHSSQVCPWD